MTLLDPELAWESELAWERDDDNFLAWERDDDNFSCYSTVWSVEGSPASTTRDDPDDIGGMVKVHFTKLSGDKTYEIWVDLDASIGQLKNKLEKTGALAATPRKRPSTWSIALMGAEEPVRYRLDDLYLKVMNTLPVRQLVKKKETPIFTLIRVPLVTTLLTTSMEG